MNPKTILIICGPTAVGKTALSIEVAAQLKTEIISADSRQCFRELNIGVAKPAVKDLQNIPHHFINSHSFTEAVDAVIFEQYALHTVEQIFKHHDVAVMVGGTGLYIKAFCNGLDNIPATDMALRNELQQQYTLNGIEWLQNMVKEKDPLYWASAEQQNPQRLLRGLEVILATGTSIINFRKGSIKQRPFRIIKAGIELPRSQLYSQINIRVDQMIKQGLTEEAQALLPHKNLNALQTVGYKELFDFFAGNISIEKAIELIKLHTRHYAKRQMTWFKKDETIHWFSPDSFATSWPALLQKG